MSRIFRWAVLGFALGTLAGAVYVFAVLGGGKASPRHPGRSVPKPTAVEEGAVREFLASLLPEGISLVGVEPLWFREQADGSFASGYRLHFLPSLSWFQLPVEKFQPPKGAGVLEKKLASYLIFYPDLEPGSCYRLRQRRVVATKGKAMVVPWTIERARLSDGRWLLEKADALPFERWGRVFTEEELAEVDKEQRSAWDKMVHTLEGIRKGALSALADRGSGSAASMPALSQPQGDPSGERVARALPVNPEASGEPRAEPGPGGSSVAPQEADGASAARIQQLYEAYERHLKRAAERQRARLREETINASSARPPEPAESR